MSSSISSLTSAHIPMTSSEYPIKARDIIIPNIPLVILIPFEVFADGVAIELAKVDRDLGTALVVQTTLQTRENTAGLGKILSNLILVTVMVVYFYTRERTDQRLEEQCDQFMLIG